jgi:hypothetical protein
VPDTTNPVNAAVQAAKGDRGTVMLTTTLITVWGLGSFTLVMAALYTLTADC